MASSSSSSHSAPRACKYDVFLSFRGEDTRKTFVDHFYSALVDRQIHTYKDNITLPKGESIGPSLLKAVEESRIAVVIFSKNYTGSSWCLEELAHIMKARDERGLIVMPVFYDVNPSEVRKQTGDFGKAFSEQEAKNIAKVDSWRKALVDASSISGWEPKNIANGHESEVIKEIAERILDRLFSLNSDVDEELVGIATRLQDLKSLLKIGSGGVRMIGIWGIGGSGKTTLASSLYKEISHYFQGHCIVDNIRVESSTLIGLKALQEKILSRFLKKKQEVQSVEEGKSFIKSRLCESNVLVLLDDVDNLNQLEALAGSHDWFGSGSRIVITTRDEHLLRTHEIDEVYHVKLLSEGDAIRLFNRRAFKRENTREGYETFSSSVVSYAAGLPLALKVLGSFLYDKDKHEWKSTLDKLKDIPDLEVMDILKTSYEGLETYQKELFLDIACFWRRRSIHEAMKILEPCNFFPQIGIKVLIQKALITIVDGDFDMHDLVEEMGHYIVRGKHPNNPEKHSRLWKKEDINNLFYREATTENHKIEVIRCYSLLTDSPHVFNTISSLKKLRWISVSVKDENFRNANGPTFLSNELRHIQWWGYPVTSLPKDFQAQKLVTLVLVRSLQKQVWNGYKHLPLLKVLVLEDMKELLCTPDFDGLPCLQELRLTDCYKLEEIHPSLGNHTTLEYVTVESCPKLKRFPVIFNMENLKTLHIKNCWVKTSRRRHTFHQIFLHGIRKLDLGHFKGVEIPSSIGKLFKLEELNLSRNVFSRLDYNLSQLTELKLLNLSYCIHLLKLPKLPSNLAILTADFCGSLELIEDSFKNCEWLCQVSLLGRGIINDGDILLQSMLEGKTAENGCMVLQIKNLDIPMGFTPPLTRGPRCRLELQENWCDDFSGFLMCVVYKTSQKMKNFRALSSSTWISMKEAASGIDSEEDDVVWEGKYDDKMYTWVGYVSFGLLRQTAWWHQPHEAISFAIEGESCRGFGVRLVPKTSRSARLTETETSTHSSSDDDVDDYTPDFKIAQDSKSGLVISLGLTAKAK